MRVKNRSDLRVIEDTSDGDAEAWPADVEFIMSALEAAGAGGGGAGFDKRRAVRVPYRTVAHLRLYSAPPEEVAVTVYTRDVCPRSLGFVTQARLPLGYGGILTFRGPDGEDLRIDVTLLRCREAVPGWYEGALYFNREQLSFQPGGDRR